ncbi:MAG: hypothetical protein ACK417_07425 [Bacteroidia bacterium]
MKYLGIFLLVVLFFSGCKDNEVACTMEFRYVSITIVGASLDSFHTQRLSTGDIILLGQESVFGDSIYPVLDDSYQQMLEGRVENFRFRGFIRDSLVVDELFVISADKCHIDYVSGRQRVEL